jgi:tetratricopeptide (TPR) repeat protein
MNQQTKTIRIFISSTFKDMHSERDYLVKYVFPELRERCMKKGISLVDVDLRWGVTEEEAEHGKAIEICLDEIENCKPFFIGILGERYGWTPEKYSVPDEPKYDWLKKFEPGHSITALEIYHGVLNKKDMKSRAFFYFRNNGFIKDVPESKQAEVKVESLAAAEKLEKIKKDINKAFTENKIPGHITENYPCTFKGLKINWNYVKSASCSELSPDEMTSLEQSIGADNVISIESYIKLNEKQKSIVDKNSTVYLDGLEEFGDTVLENIWKAIDEENPDEKAVTDPLLIEKGYHKRFMDSRTALFIGRIDILGKISDYLNDKGNHKPLFITGEPGSGKSAIMAVSAQQNNESDKKRCNIIRFVGASPDSLDIIKLIKGIIYEIASEYFISPDQNRIDDFKELYQYFRELLFTVSGKGRLVIYIDAVNQLLPQYDPQFLTWLPLYLPEKVKIVLSTTPGEYIKSAEKYELPCVKVSELTKENSAKIANDTLKVYRKELDEIQLKILLSKADSNKPLYLKVACEELRVFPIFEQITTRIKDLPETIPELFMQMLERLEADHDPKLVKDALCLIENSMYGLIESELLELLKPEDKDRLPVNIWARLYRNLSAYLMNLGEAKEGLLEFFHLQLSEAVQKRYLENVDIAKQYYKRLADYGLEKYNKKDGNTVNTVAYTGIYLYRSVRENTLYKLIKDIFTSEEIYRMYKKAADNLFDWVVNNYEFEAETLLRSVLGMLTKSEHIYLLGVFLNNKAYILKVTGKTRWALEFSEKDLKVMEEMVSLEPGRTNFRRDLSACLNNAGQIYQCYGEYLKALEFYEKALKLMEDLVNNEPKSLEYKRELSVNLDNIGNIFRCIGEGQKAYVYYKKAQQVMKELVSLEPCSNYLIDWSFSLDKIGDILKVMGSEQLALKHYKLALKIIEKMHSSESGNAVLKNDFSVSLNKVGNIYYNKGENKKALMYYKRSLKVIENLVYIEPEWTDFRKQLSITLGHVGNIYKALGENKKALYFISKSLKVIEELVVIEPGRSDFMNELSCSFRSVGRMYEVIGKEKIALDFIKKSFKQMTKLVNLEPKNTDYIKNLSVDFDDIGRIFKKMGKLKKSLEYSEKSLQLSEELLSLEPWREDFRKDLSKSYCNVGNIYKDMGEVVKSLEYFNKDLKIYDEYHEFKDDNKDFIHDLVFRYLKVGNIYTELGQNDKAIEYYQVSQRRMEELIKLVPKRVDYIKNLAVIYSYIANAYRLMGEVKLAFLNFDKYLKAKEELVTIEPSSLDIKRDLSASYNGVGNMCMMSGEVNKALKYYRKDLSLLQELVSLEPGREDYIIDLAMSYWSIYLVSKQDKKLFLLNKIKTILLPLVNKGVQNDQMMQLWKVVNESITSNNIGNATSSNEDLAYNKENIVDDIKNFENFPENIKDIVDKMAKSVTGVNFLNSNPQISKSLEESFLREMEKSQSSYHDNDSKINYTARRLGALAFYKVGHYKEAKLLLEELLQNNFEVLSTRMHLARIALITDDLKDAKKHTGEAWNMRKEAPAYVLPRILWCRLCLTFINKPNSKLADNIIGQLKTVLQNKDALVEWTMQPVLDHLKPKLSESQHAFLSALVDAMSFQDNVGKLDEFPEWRNSKAIEI